MAKDERIALVNEKDEVIGYKMRSELTDDDCWRVIAIWVENNQSQVLIQQRASSVKINPGLWSNAVMGTVTEDSSYDETAKRELQEEIGLSGVRLEKTSKVHYKASFGWRISQGYTVVCDWPAEKFELQAEEVSRVEWISKTQILDEISDKIPHSREYTTAYPQWPKLFNLV